MGKQDDWNGTDDILSTYVERITKVINSYQWSNVMELAESILETWRENKQFFLCGNGGSAGNAIHLANDFLYGINRDTGIGMKVEALSANPSVLTCLGNDVGYEEIFSQQLLVKAEKGDLLVILSGSGNSKNVVRALRVANDVGMKTFAILGYDGGKCLEIAQTAIHFPVNDMQISEDLQLIVGHMCMQWVSTKKLIE